MAKIVRLTDCIICAISLIHLPFVQLLGSADFGCSAEILTIAAMVSVQVRIARSC